MEQLEIHLPYSFICERTRLSWAEVQYGIKERILRPQDAIEVARDELEQEADNQRILHLASSSHDESVLDRVAQLAAAEPRQDPRAIQRKWAFLVLAWVLEHRARYSDPLDVAEKVYADLDYPEQVAPFIRYMPSDEPDLGSKELNEQRLFQKWTDYVKAEALVYSRPPGLEDTAVAKREF